MQNTPTSKTQIFKKQSRGHAVCLLRGGMSSRCWVQWNSFCRQRSDDLKGLRDNFPRILFQNHIASFLGRAGTIMHQTIEKSNPFAEINKTSSTWPDTQCCKRRAVAFDSRARERHGTTGWQGTREPGNADDYWCLLKDMHDEDRWRTSAWEKSWFFVLPLWSHTHSVPPVQEQSAWILQIHPGEQLLRVIVRPGCNSPGSDDAEFVSIGVAIL